MSNIRLYTTYYHEKKDYRSRELSTCLHRNLNNAIFKSVTVFNEGGDLNEMDSPKLKIIYISKRPTYQDFLNYINNNSTNNDIHIIANSDIYFDEQVGVLRHLNLDDKCLAISRWDTTESNKPKLYNHNDSQDVWIFKGLIKRTLSADFPLGVPRCDNRLIYELYKSGYEVLNPAFSIKAYHIHKGQRVLVYTEDDNVYKIEPPYRYKYPHNMFGLWQTLWFNMSHKPKLAAYRYDVKKFNNLWVIRLPRKIVEVLTKKKMRLIGYNYSK
jgi:hypothetical protein